MQMHRDGNADICRPIVRHNRVVSDAMTAEDLCSWTSSAGGHRPQAGVRTTTRPFERESIAGGRVHMRWFSRLRKLCVPEPWFDCESQP